MGGFIADQSVGTEAGEIKKKVFFIDKLYLCEKVLHRGDFVFQKMRIFRAVARKLSFTEAALELGISQSAASQSVAALEKRLGVQLLGRHGRRIELTSAGRRFADGAEEILASLERLENEVRQQKVVHFRKLNIAYSNLFRGDELQKAIVRFAAECPDVEIHVAALSHETIYEQLLSGRIDLALSDQRRAFSSDFTNVCLAETPVYAELSARHPLARKKRFAVSDLGAMSCILVVPSAHREVEREYYSALLGFKGDFLFAESLDAARLMASGGRSFLLAQGRWAPEKEGSPAGKMPVTRCLPIFKAGRLVKERFCAFSLLSHRTALTDAFTRTLVAVFEESYSNTGASANRSSRRDGRKATGIDQKSSN